ncbi:hypothetical protein B0H34DRAFT_696257 [Crassisporium funariophilum]|nr:hypothetical protein B0H34DRAFT_696257 [Crassisporium funariophilum]
MHMKFLPSWPFQFLPNMCRPIKYITRSQSPRSNKNSRATINLDQRRNGSDDGDNSDDKSNDNNRSSQSTKSDGNSQSSQSDDKDRNLQPATVTQGIVVYVTVTESGQTTTSPSTSGSIGTPAIVNRSKPPSLTSPTPTPSQTIRHSSSSTSTILNNDAPPQSLSSSMSLPLPLGSILAIIMGTLFLVTIALVIYVFKTRFDFGRRQPWKTIRSESPGLLPTISSFEPREYTNDFSYNARRHNHTRSIRSLVTLPSFLGRSRPATPINIATGPSGYPTSQLHRNFSVSRTSRGAPSQSSFMLASPTYSRQSLAGKEDVKKFADLDDYQFEHERVHQLSPKSIDHEWPPTITMLTTFPSEGRP